MGLSDQDFWSLTQAQFLALMDRHEIAKYEANCYLYSINKILFVANIGSKNSPPVLSPPILSTDIPKTKTATDPAAILMAFEAAFPNKKQELKGN